MSLLVRKAPRATLPARPCPHRGRAGAQGRLAAEYVAGAHARPWTGEGPSSDARFGVRYRTPDSAITTEVTVTRQTVRRVVTTGSAATELIPLVVHPADRVTFTDGTSASYGSATTAIADDLTLRRGRTTVQIRWAAVRTASLTAMPTTYLRGGARRAHLLRIPHDGTLHLTVGFG
ncbi:hypothetical protein ACWD0A_04385 [Streptomyces sp. NPDC002867]